MSSNASKTGAQIVVESLERHGVTPVFGIPGAKIDKGPTAFLCRFEVIGAEYVSISSDGSMSLALPISRQILHPRSRLTVTGVAVEKLVCGKTSKIMSRQDALQAICRKQLTIYHPQKSCPSCEFRVFQQPQVNALIEYGWVGSSSVSADAVAACTVVGARRRMEGVPYGSTIEDEPLKLPD